MVHEHHKMPKIPKFFHNHVIKSNAVISCEEYKNDVFIVFIVFIVLKKTEIFLNKSFIV